MAKLIQVGFLDLHRTITDIQAGQKISDVLEYDRDLYDVVVSKNGKIVECLDAEVVEDDYIGMMLIPAGGGGGGGNSVRLVLTIILIVVVTWVSLGAGGSLATSASSGLFGVGTAASWAAAATMVAGTLLINAVAPLNGLNDFGSFGSLSSISQSATYGWERKANWAQAGNAIPYLAGKLRIAPPGIARYISSTDDTQTLHMLFLCGFGTFDSISDIQINGESIDNFTGVSWDYRLGTLNQSLIDGFKYTYKEKDVSKIVNMNASTYSTSQTDGNAVETLGVGLKFGGLCYIDDNNNVVTYSVKVVMEYSSDGVNWIRFGGDTAITTYPTTYIETRDTITSILKYTNEQTGEIVTSLPSNAVYIGKNEWNLLNRYGIPYTYFAPYTTISAATVSVLYKKFIVTDLAPAQYQVRVRYYETPASTTRYKSAMMFEYLEEGVADGFIYPMQALLAVHIQATEQLSGSYPAVTCLAKRGSSNPATIVREALTNPFLKTKFSNANIIDEEFTEWENTCTENGYEANFYCDQKITLRNFLDTVSLAGQASIIQFGNQFGVIEDKPGLIPVDKFTFGMGNIIEDSFNITYLPTSQRATSLSVTYYDEELDYTRQEVTVLADNTTTTQNSASFPLLAVTKRQKVIDFATRQLNGNKHIDKLISWAADKDGVVCRPGDVVGISHDILNRDFSGRLLQGCTDTVIILDRDVEMTSDCNYYLDLFFDDNSRVTANVVTQEGTTDTLTLSSALSVIPDFGVKYIFREISVEDLDVRITKISYSSDVIATIQGVPYIPEVYETGVTIPRDEEPTSWMLRGLYASDNLRLASDGTIEEYMSLVWRGKSMYYDIFVDDVFYKRVYDAKTDITGYPSGQTYALTVKDSYGKSISTTLDFEGKKIPPQDIISLDVQNSFSSIKKLVWSYTPPLDFAGYEIRYCLGNTLDWYHGQKLHDGLLLSSPYDANLGGIAGVYTVMIKAVDTTGNYSINPAYAVFNEGDADVVNLIEEQIYDLSTVEVSNMELVGSTLKVPLSTQLWAMDRTAPLWSANKTAPLWDSSYPLGYAIFKYKAPSKTGKIKLTIETDGVTNIYYRVNDGVLWSLDNTAPLWDNDRTKPLWTIGEWLPYTGEFDISLSRYEFKVEYPTQNYQSVLSHFSVIQDVEDITEEFNNLHISASGTRLPITKTYSVIKSVPASVQSDGNGGVTYQVIDKDPVNGALVKVLNSAGAAVNGIIDAKVIGYYAG